MTRKKAEVAPLSDEEVPNPNPPTEPVPEDPIPLPEEPTGPVPEAAPVWEGGDPGVAVPSADDQDDTYYHPEGEAPPEPPLDTDGDGTPDETDLDDDEDGLTDDVDDDDDGDGTLDVDEPIV
jgi:hypothetical protein